MRKEVLTWQDVDALIDHLIPQFDVAFEAMVMISRGGLVPGGLLAEALDITHLLLAAVDFPAQMAADRQRLVAWPQFIQFPAEHQLAERRVLIVDDVWGSGRTMTAVRARVEAAGATPYTCVLHFNPTGVCSAPCAPIFTRPSPTLTSFTPGKSSAAPTAF